MKGGETGAAARPNPISQCAAASRYNLIGSTFVAEKGHAGNLNWEIKYVKN
jgi:hypothetical protein